MPAPARLRHSRQAARPGTHSRPSPARGKAAGGLPGARRACLLWGLSQGFICFETALLMSRASRRHRRSNEEPAEHVPRDPGATGQSGRPRVSDTAPHPGARGGERWWGRGDPAGVGNRVTFALDGSPWRHHTQTEGGPAGRCQSRETLVVSTGGRRRSRGGSGEDPRSTPAAQPNPDPQDSAASTTAPCTPRSRPPPLSRRELGGQKSVRLSNGSAL